MANMVFEHVEPEKKVFHFGGTDVTVVKNIPFGTKLECAGFVAVRICFEDSEQKGLAVWALDDEVIKMQAALKYYTDANVEGMGKDSLYKMYDALWQDEAYRNFRRYIEVDWYAVEDILEQAVTTLGRRIEHKAQSGLDWQSLLSEFLNDPNPDATIAKNRAVNEYLIDLMGKAQAYDKRQNATMKGITKNDLKDSVVSFSKKR